MNPTTQSAVPFSRRLRDDTRRAHTLTENTDFLRGFVRGIIDAHSYLRLLADLHHVYCAMETALDRAAPDCPAVAAVWFPGLRRVAALETDLATFSELAGVGIPAPSGAARRYARHIAEVADRRPALLVAHAYTRYMGDMSGGQLLRSILRRSLTLPEGVGTAFYEFAELPELGVAKNEFRARLDALPDATPELHDAIVAEANRVFALNLDLFRALGGNTFFSLLRLLRQFAFSTVRRGA